MFGLHEVKKTKSIEDAGIWQLKYYMYYLEKRGIENISASIDYPLLRETKSVELEEDDRKILDITENAILEIIAKGRPPEIVKVNTCKKCAYYDLCYV